MYTFQGRGVKDPDALKRKQEQVRIFYARYFM